MRQILFAFIFISLSFGEIYSQDSIVRYFPETNQIESIFHVNHQTNQELYHGPFVVFYPNGSAMSRGSYSLGQLHGWQESFDQNGILLEKKRYTNGILNGEHTLYYPSGNLKERKLMINGKIQGEYRFYPDAAEAAPEKIEIYQMGIKK